jgi:ATP-dependent Zn protease
VSERSLVGTAHHEAGHAVASIYLRQRIVRATIVPKKDSLGMVTAARLKFADHHIFDCSPRGIDRAEKRIIICYAGPLASRKFAPRSRWKDTGSSDFEIATDLLSHLQVPDDKCNVLYAKLLWRRAECLVEHHWKDICAVAKALLERRTLDQTDVIDVMSRTHRQILQTRGGVAT